MDLPLPVASLLRRARNEKSPKARHDTAYFAWEASIRLLVAAGSGGDRAGLKVPSTGDWVRAASVPDRRIDNPAVLEAFALLTEVGLGKRSRPKSVPARQLLDALPAYRNQIIGHGGIREAGFYDTAFHALTEALEALWREAFFWPADGTLAYIDAITIAPDGTRFARVLDVSGLASRVTDVYGKEIVPASALPLRLYLRQGPAYTPLHPWLLYQEDDLGEHIWFFNGKKRGAYFLDFLSGRSLRGESLVKLFPGIDAMLDELFDSGTAPEGETEAEDPSIFDDYRVVGKLGEGGMGIVYLARHKDLGKLVALKTLPQAAAGDPIALARFRREIEALARCEHPNIVKILAAGEARGTHFFVMELVAGADLGELGRALATTPDFYSAVESASERVRNARKEAFVDIPDVSLASSGDVLGKRPRDRVCALGEMFRDAARAVQHLHDQGIVHRDIKPANLMITAQDHRIVLMDLGLALLGDASRTLTQDASSLLGTLRYMPPEQLQRNLVALDKRVDIYAIGATFYELFTGRPIFDGDTEARLVEQVLREQPADARRLNPALPKDLGTILQKTIQKDPKLRYESAEALARDVDAFLQGKPIGARAPTLAYVFSLSVRRHKALAASIALSLFAVIVGTLFFLYRERSLRYAAEQEQGRAELLAGRPLSALARLSAVYSSGASSTALRSLLADATRPFDALQRTFAGHTDGVLDIGISPDGSRIVTASRDDTVRVWDASTGAVQHVLRGHHNRVNSASFSPDGRIIATGSWDHSVKLWESVTGRLLHSLESPAGHTDVVWSVAFSPDGARVLSMSWDGTAKLWDSASGSLLCTLKGHTKGVWAGGFAASGNRIVTGSDDGTARIWDIAPDSEAQAGLSCSAQTVLSDSQHVLAEADPKEVRAATFSTDGSAVLTGGYDHKARVWDAATGALRCTFERHEGLITFGAFSHDGKLAVTAGEDGTARIFHPDTCLEVAVLRGHRGPILTAAVSPDNAELMTGSWDGTAKRWSLPSGKLLASLAGHHGSITAVAFSPAQPFAVTASRDGTARQWDLGVRKLLLILHAHAAGVMDAQFSADATRIATRSGDGLARVWDAKSGALIRDVTHGGRVQAMQLSPDGARILTGAADGTARIWDIDLGSTLDLPTGAPVTVVAFSADGKRAGGGCADGTIALWDAATGSPIARVAAHRDAVRSIAWSARAERIVTASSDGTARVVGARAGGGDGILLSGHKLDLYGAAISPDGTRVVTAGGDNVGKLWDAVTGREIAVLEGHFDKVTAVAYDHRGEKFLTASDDATVRVWSKHGELIAVLEGHTGGILTAEFSPDDARIVTAGWDKHAHIWDAATGRLLSVLEEHHGRIWSAHFSSNGNRLVTASEDRTALVWDVALETRTPGEITALVARSEAPARPVSPPP